MSEKRQDKKEQFAEPEKKNSKVMLIVCVALAVVVGIGAAFALNQSSDGGYLTVKSVNGEVRLDVSKIDDGQAHYFKYATANGEINFFVIKSVDGEMRAAFDACDVCYREKKGYRQEGTMMVCNNCGMKFRSDMINLVKGGCNPAPLNRRIDGSQLVINDSDIVKGAWYFGG